MSIYGQPLEWIKAAVDSVRNQTYSNWQLLIRPDGPKAISRSNLELLQELESRDPRLRVLPGNECNGTFGSYRLIFSESKAKYLVQLDADDILHPSALLKAVQHLDRHKKSPFLYSQCMLINDQGMELGLDKRALRTWQKNADLVQFISFHMRMIRRSAYLKVGGYNSNYYFAGDYDLSLRLAELGKPQHLAEPLYGYRVHTNSESQRKRHATHQEAVKSVREALTRRGMDSSHELIHSLRTETITLTKKINSPIVVVGMHRSATSLLARMLSRLGVSFGTHLLSEDDDNPDGYYEDTAFLELQRNWFASSLDNNSKGWRDWGWNPIQSISSLGKSRWKSQADQLLKKRQLCFSDSRWGWKDPRTTLLLPFWRQLSPELKLIGIYRTPWDISDALQRLRHPKFRKDPEIIHLLWKLYNERLIAYLEAEPERSIVVSADALAANPEQLTSILHDRWGWIIDESEIKIDLKALIRSDRLQKINLPDPIETLYQLLYPDIMHVWLQLQDIADMGNIQASKDKNDMPLLKCKAPSQPVLSIVIPTFNPCHYLVEAIASVERHRNVDTQIEIIIVDDGSKLPHSIHLLEQLSSAGFQVLKKKNSGLAAARNSGIRASKAELILPLDDDNRLLSLYLNDGLQYMLKNAEIDLLFGDRIDFGAHHQRFRPGALKSDQLVKVNTVDACAIIRRSLWASCGGYDERLKALEDWDLWLSGLRRGMKSCYVPVPAFEYRVREVSMLQRHLADHESHNKTIEYLRKKHNLPIQSLIGD
ncbi:glycosyltransferase [Prochlorococcus sp. MIT 1306]|uniref:glycosyltransferase n=1 Tax=Prochlorococcus sp. MIT 1306 TaxID=1799667 RepID=UPI0007B3CA26|nr:glycosyltransferase [Prochlorococcus sp. MIT 1306]